MTVEEGTLLHTAYAAARWGWYATLFLVLGAGTYAPSLLGARTALDAVEPALARRLAARSARIGLFAAILLLLLTLIRLHFQLRTFLDPGEPISRDLIRATLGTVWGKGWMSQGTMAVLAVIAFGWAIRGGRAGWVLAHASGGGLGLAAGATGHAMSEAAGRYGLLLDAAHVWAGGLWLGGLALLLGAAIPSTRGLEPAARRQALRALVADFSRRALIMAPAAVLLGAALSVSYIGWRWPLELTASAYGRLLGLKLLALVGAGAVGFWNWRVVQPGLTGEGGERRLVSSGLAEVTFGALLLAVTALLVATALPGEGM